jgi:hypothetical protein
MEYEDFMHQQAEVNELRSNNLALLGDHLSMSNTIQILLKVKCKHASTLTIELDHCLETNFETIYKAVNRKENLKSGELLVWMITKLLRGTQNNEVSCIVLDTNAIVYLESALSQPEPIYTAKTIEEFSTNIQNFLKQKVIGSPHEMGEVFSECWIHILNPERFETFVRKALAIYKQR